MNRSLIVIVVLLFFAYVGWGAIVKAEDSTEVQEETTVEVGDRTYVEVAEPKPAWERQGMTEAEYEAWAAEVREARAGEQMQRIQEKIEQDMQSGGKLDEARQRKEAFDARHRR